MAKWFVHTDVGQLGPYTSTEMRGLVTEGTIGLMTPIRREGQCDWVTARSVKNLFKTSCIKRRTKQIKGDTTEEAAAVVPMEEAAKDLAGLDAMVAEGEAAGLANAAQPRINEELGEELTDEQDEVMAALEELDAGSEGDWDSFFQEHGTQLRGDEISHLAASPRELRQEGKRGRVKPKILGPVHRKPGGEEDDDPPPRSDIATPSEAGVAAAILGKDVSEILGEPAVSAADPSTVENVAVGPRGGTTNPVVVIVIVGLAVMALGVAVFFLAKAFARSRGGDEAFRPVPRQQALS